MNSDWTQRSILKLAAWRQKYWLAKDYVNLIEPSRHALDALLENTSNQFKHDRTTTVARVELAGDHDTQVVIKRYNARNKWHTVKRALRKTRARRCWQMSYRFQQAGLNVAEPILMYEHRLGWLHGDAYFVNRFLEGEILLDALPDMETEQQDQVIAAITRAFEIMRTERLSHGDMKASNLLWVGGELVFIDLDAARQHQSKLFWRRANRRDKKRFLKNWRGNKALLARFKDL
ncbi:MAG: lipopolysaccharide kinase InaA family protein [Pseudomonadota bacterium]